MRGNSRRPEGRLSDRYDPKPLRRCAEAWLRDRRMADVLNGLGLDGCVCHLLREVVDQHEDELTILIGDRVVARLELSRSDLSAAPQEVQLFTFEDYRRIIGQGRQRMLLDAAAETARNA